MSLHFESPKFARHGWRKLISDSFYQKIHSFQFRGARRIRNFLGLEPIDPEKLVSAILCESTCENEVFVDVGSQHGRHVRALFEYNDEKTRAIAVEANPHLAAALKKNFEAEILNNRLQVVHAAAGQSDGRTVFHVNVRDSGYSGMRQRNLPECGADYVISDVEVVTIETLVASLEGRIACIKIDVEGAERDVLLGARTVLKHDRPLVLFECAKNAAPYYGYELKDLVEWFEDLNYRVATLAGQSVEARDSNQLFESGICHDFVAFPEEELELRLTTLRKIVGRILGVDISIKNQSAL